MSGIAELVDALQDMKSAMAEHHFKTQSRVFRGLEALDHREEQRHSVSDNALNAAFGELAARIDTFRHELRLIDKSARRQMEDLSGRIYTTLDGMVEVLGYLKAEIASIHYSLDASRAEARLKQGSESSRDPDT
jgi:hypothetical protein